MTDFEIASLAFREMAAWAAIATAVATAIAAVVVGPTQCLLIWKGLRLMDRSNRERAVALEQQREADERRHTEAMAAHAEVMAAHAETMAAHAETMATLAAQSRALEALIERTAPAAAR